MGQNPSKFAVVSEEKKFPRKNARRKRNMKNGIKVIARMVKQLVEALDGVKDLELLSDKEIAELTRR